MAKDNFNNDELTAYYSKIYEQLEAGTSNDPFGSYVLGRVKGGQKTVLNKSQSEIRNFDMSYLDTIESVYPAIYKIMKDPKKSLRYEQEVVAVEKARKVNADTVRHLSSHTHLIKEIKKNGDVIPSKVLTTYTEEELAIYENRFIKSLVKRMEMFLERRYEVMKISLESFETERLNVKNEFKMSGQMVTVELDVAIKNDLTTNVETTKEQFDRLCYMREMVQALKGTEFMRALAKARDVLPPIMKTNIILHNPDFKLCYGLWLYLDRVDSVATNIDIKEKSYKYSQVFDKDISECMALALTAFIKNRQIEGIYSSKKLDQKKAPKPILDNTPELELNLEADNKKLEDYTMNELLLSQTAKFFEASLTGIQKTGVTYNESIRVVYRQMLDMLDQIYPMAFGVGDDELNAKDLYEQLEYARRQLMVFKIVHQQKQMNIARMGKESKRIENLIKKLEEKIKREEARQREREERERLKAEQERQAELERQRQAEARKRKFEKDAIAKAKEVELRRQDMLKEEKDKDNKRRESLARLFDAHKKKTEYLIKQQEEDNKNFNELTPTEIAQQAPAPVPQRRRDEYDDLSDDELAKLMEENEMLLNQIPEKDSELAEEQAKVQALEDKANKEPKKSKKKTIEDTDIEDLSDSDLEKLLAQNMEGDINFGASDLRDEPKVIKKKPTISKKKKMTDEEREEAENQKILEDNPEDNSNSELDNMSDEDLDKLINDNGFGEEPAGSVNDLPNDPKLNKENKKSSGPTIKTRKQEPKVTFNDNNDKEPEKDDLQDISDEDLDALMKENGIADEESLQKEPKQEAKPTIKRKPKPDSEKKKEESDNLDDLSDEDLDKLMKENGLFE